MINRADGKVRPPHLQSSFPQPIERAAAGALLREMSIDVDQRASAAIFVDDVLVPDSVERGIGHVPRPYCCRGGRC